MGKVRTQKNGVFFFKSVALYIIICALAALSYYITGRKHSLFIFDGRL